jgi:hypothetical protein
MYKQNFTIEVSLTNRRYKIARSLGVPIKNFIGQLSSMAKIKRKKKMKNKIFELYKPKSLVDFLNFKKKILKKILCMCYKAHRRL